MQQRNVAELDLGNLDIAQLRVGQPYEKVIVQNLCGLASLGDNGFQKYLTRLPERWVPLPLFPYCSWVQVIGNIALDDLHAVLGVSDCLRLSILADCKPALPVANPALVDEDLVPALVAHTKANQFGVPNYLIGLHTFDNRLGDVFSY